jgi:isocitrate/isopropylmalate dehydrogenase
LQFFYHRDRAVIKGINTPKNFNVIVTLNNFIGVSILALSLFV